MTESGRLLWNEDGRTLDEIVYHGYVHIEQMSDDEYWMGIGESHFLFTANKGKLYLHSLDMHADDFPLEQRHKTQAEVDSTLNLMGEQGWAHITIRDDRSEDERVDSAAIWLAAGEGKGWAKLTGWQRDKYRRRARKL